MSESEQAMSLRRLRRMLGGSQHNLHVCTAQLHLVDLLLRWLRPPALPLSEVVRSELLGLVGELGGYRVTMHELGTLFDLLRSSLDSLRLPPDASQLAPMSRGDDVFHRGPHVPRACGIAVEDALEWRRDH